MKINNFKLLIICLLFFLSLFEASLFAQIPHTISYQGLLTDAEGNPKPDGDYTITFSLYDSQTGGEALWQEGKTLILTKGLFSTSLGDQVIFGSYLTFNKPYWLGIKIANESELSPRIALTSSGFSFSSIISDTAKNIIDGKVVKSLNGLTDHITLEGNGGTTINTNGDTIKISSSGGGGTGLQGIQNTNNTLDISNSNGPTATVNLKTPLLLGNSGNEYTLRGVNSGNGGGLSGESVYQYGYGVYGLNSGGGYGVYGSSPSGAGVVGISKSWDGIYGETSTWFGVYGKATGENGKGVYGESATSYGVWGKSPNGTGVVGESEKWVGVYGQSNDNNGVWGKSSFGYGVFGQSIFGHSIVGLGQDGAFGVLGFYQSNGDFGYGVYGKQGSTNLDYAGFFEGTLVVDNGRMILDGNLDVTGSKNFKIDHPLDPANKYLVHSCIESPERKNEYDGNVITDANGLAIVKLPEYFDALNIDYRYQLTVIGQFAQAIVENKIRNNLFTIRTDKPNVEVSWQVTGIRNDEYAKQHPFVAEEEKEAFEKGKYLTPELYKQPKEKGIFYVKTDFQKEIDNANK